MSLYLDAARFLAALTVFLGHVAYQKWSGGWLWQITPFGTRAVDVFFVISGFVIAYVCHGRETDLRTYAIDRAARIYSVVIPAIALTLALDAVGQAVNEAPYLPVTASAMAPLLSSALSLVFVGQAWWMDYVPGNDGPFWSLGYEVPYYATFGLFRFGPRRWRWLLAALVLAAAGPQIAALFPIWLFGVAAFHIGRLSALKRWQGVALFAASLLALGASSSSEMPTSVTHTITGLAFASSLVGLRAAAFSWTPVLTAFSRPVSWISGATFSLYLYHWPLMEFLVAVSPWPVTTLASRIFTVGGTFAAVLLLAGATERRKSAWRHAIIRLVRLACRPTRQPCDDVAGS